MLSPLPKPKSKSEKKRLEIQLRAQQERLEKAKKEKDEISPISPYDPEIPGICVIIDIDGVLARRGDRGVFDFDKSIDDSVHAPVKFYLQLIDDANRYKNSAVPNPEIILITGREQQFSDVTNRWLNAKSIPFDRLFMRNTGDHRPSDIVKEEIWAGNIRGKYNVLFVIEDDPKNIRMFQKHGMYVFAADSRDARVR